MMTTDELNELMKTLIAALHEWIERKKAACQDCGGSGCDAPIEVCYAYDIKPRKCKIAQSACPHAGKCPTCAALDAIKAKWCWHEWDDKIRQTLDGGYCKHCNKKLVSSGWAMSEYSLKKHNPTPTIETLRQLMESLEVDQQKFIDYIMQGIVDSMGECCDIDEDDAEFNWLLSQCVYILIRIFQTPTLLTQAITSYLEVN